MSIEFFQPATGEPYLIVDDVVIDADAPITLPAVEIAKLISAFHAQGVAAGRAKPVETVIASSPKRVARLTVTKRDPVSGSIVEAIGSVEDA